LRIDFEKLLDQQGRMLQVETALPSLALIPERLVMREAVDGQMFFKGRLGGIETDSDHGDRGPDVVVIISDDGRSHRVPIGVITRANLEVEF